jgi:hypothetical protein
MSSAHIRKLERAQTNNLIMYLKVLEKQEQATPKSNKLKEIIKISAEINEWETKTNNKKDTMNQ